MKLEKMLVVIVLLPFIMACSSKQREIVYEYNGTIITRVDKEKETFLYVDHKKAPVYFINWEEENGFAAYLIFNPNGTVEIVNLYGGFNKINECSTFYITKRFNWETIDFDNVSFSNWIDSIKGRYNNVVYIEALDQVNKFDENYKNKTKVKILLKTK